MSKHTWIRRLTHLLLALGLCSLVFPIPAQPAAAGAHIQAGTVINVTTQTDELNNDGDCSLREAMRAANQNIPVDRCPSGSGYDTVAVEPGTYNLSLKGIGEDNGATGDLDIFDDVVIVGASLVSTILDGQASDRIFHVTTNVEIKFINLTLRNGYAVDSLYGGGGILNGSSYELAGNIHILNCILTGNRAVNTGGGLENVGTATLMNVSLIENQASFGGGVYSDGTISLQGVSLQDNTASGTGGGLDNHTGAYLENVTFSGNTSGEGGGIFNDGSITMLNVTFSGNSSAAVNNGTIRSKNTIFANSTEGDNCAGQKTLTSAGHNLDSGDTCNLSGVGDLVNTDPMLGPLEDNQGPTLTHALLDGSPAIDSGDNNDCPLQDQRSAYRPADGDEDDVKVCDIGAFEFAGLFPFYIFLPSVARH